MADEYKVKAVFAFCGRTYFEGGVVCREDAAYSAISELLGRGLVSEEVDEDDDA